MVEHSDAVILVFRVLLFQCELTRNFREVLVFQCFGTVFPRYVHTRNKLCGVATFVKRQRYRRRQAMETIGR